MAEPQRLGALIPQGEFGKVVEEAGAETNYKLTSTKASGSITLTYRKGVLKVVKLGFRKPLSNVAFGYWTSLAKHSEKEFREALLPEAIRMEVVTKDTEISKKIGLFCKIYNAQPHITNENHYTATQKDLRDVKTVEVTEELLKKFFKCAEWWAKQKTLANYCIRINEIRAYTHEEKSKFPDTYDPVFEKTLTGTTITDYWKHLRSLGWVNEQGFWREEKK